MNPETIYPYSQHNLLDQAEYYMFSAYRGQVFLRAYFEQRAMFLADFERCYLDKLQRQDQSSTAWLRNWKGIIEQNEHIFSKDIHEIHTGFLLASGDERTSSGIQSISELDLEIFVNTKQALQLLLHTAVERNPMERDNYLLWLNYFIKRFEVNKKLYTAYHQSSAKRASEDYRDFLNYALLSLTLLYDYEWSGNLKMVNTAIKLGDLLCSLIRELSEPETFLVAILALHKEISIIQQIMIDKQVGI